MSISSSFTKSGHEPSFLLGVSLIGIAFFVLPLLAFHKDLQRQKAGLMKAADQLSQEIIAKQQEIMETQSGDEVQKLKEQLTAKIEYYKAIRQMPTWPVHIKLFWSSILATLVVVLPPILTQFLSVWFSK